MLNQHPQVQIQVAGRAYLFYLSEDKLSMKTTFPDGFEMSVTFKVAGFEVAGKHDQWTETKEIEFPVTLGQTMDFLANKELSSAHMEHVNYLATEIHRIYCNHASYTSKATARNVE